MGMIFTEAWFDPFRRPVEPMSVAVLLLSVCSILPQTGHAVWADDQYARLGRLNLNTDPRYSRWPNPTHVPFLISAGDYNPHDLAVIRDSMDQIFMDTLGCVKFTEYNATADAGKDYIVISPAIDGTCWSYPGLLPSSGSGQKLGISPGQYGCLDSKRLVMKTLFHVLGKRSEHNRPDRDDYLAMHLENLDPVFVPFNPFQKYLDSTVYYQGFPYDYNSITHHLPNAYANPETTVFTLKDPTKSIGDKARLSYWDCYAMAIQYQCRDIIKNDFCRNVDAYKPSVTVLSGVPIRSSFGQRSPVVNTPRPTAAPTTTTTTTTTTPTTTTTSTSPAPLPPILPDYIPLSPAPVLDQDVQNQYFAVPQTDPQPNSIADATKADYVTLVRKNGAAHRDICSAGFTVDAAVQSQDGRILIFSGNDYYVITTAGYIKDGPLPIARDFPDIPALPVTAAYSTVDGQQKTTHIISAQNDYTYVDLTFLDYLPIVEDDLLQPNLKSVFTLPDPINPQNYFEYRLYSGDSAVQYFQAGSRGRKTPLTKSRFFIGNSSQAPSLVDAVVSFKIGSLGNTQDVALVFSGDHLYLMDVDYSCMSTLKFPCLNGTKRPRFPVPIRSVLNCSAYAIGRSFSGASSSARA